MYRSSGSTIRQKALWWFRFPKRQKHTCLLPLKNDRDYPCHKWNAGPEYNGFVASSRIKSSYSSNECISWIILYISSPQNPKLLITVSEQRSVLRRPFHRFLRNRKSDTSMMLISLAATKFFCDSDTVSFRISQTLLPFTFSKWSVYLYLAK